ncbi:MAG: hypothetical protein L6R40_005235 [Gallowayella cf. fulva]|nr:MAG: hypothetical protein L6R40_005235 [Xanthomendoza cf. fulva]
MASFIRLAALTALLVSSASIVAGVATSGSGHTTRYWDCCKPSCAWSRDGLTAPVKTCDINDKPLANGVTAQSGCQGGGTSFMCSDQSPWAVNDNLAYGFAAVTAANPTCCTCYKLTFTTTSIKGKTMIVQATNTGNDVSGTQFDLAMPGGGFGQFDGCSKEWKATPDIWGAQYGGSNTNQCSKFPSPLQKGCGFRWDWMQGQSNPEVQYEQVTCPAEIVAKSGCSVSGYSSPQQPAPTTTTTKKASSPITTTTASRVQTPAPKKASDPSYSSSAGGDDESSNRVVDEGNSHAAASGIGGFVSEAESRAHNCCSERFRDG